MKKNIGLGVSIAAAGITIGWCFIMYVLFAFTNWKMNPAEWSSDARFFYSFVSFIGIVIGGGIIVAVTLDVYEDKNK